MSSGRPVRHRSTSASSANSSKANNLRFTAPPTTLTPENADGGFQPCAATASFLLYSQRNTVLVLHQDTLAIERRCDLHQEDVLWIQVDNSSERGFGRLAVSYDAGNTAIVWDILTGGEVARFTAYEHMRVASFMRNGNIAFGNDQGSVILFEPSTSEHISARTIFDPVTAIAPSSDCRTFAIGYLNGSILVATLQPSFTILHTLTTNRAPSRITGLAWHGSSSKQKTDMLATQTSDGDLRVWSVPKIPHSDLAPTIIRVLQRADLQPPTPCWFAWSKNGRIVQYAEGETRTWDVRTKRVTYEVIPTIEDIVGMATYGPTATLFTLGRNHTVQQYDISPSSKPMQVAAVQHMPANTPPTPPTVLEPHGHRYADPQKSSLSSNMGLPSTDAESSADESGHLSPLQKIAQEMDSLDALESEIRDKVMPLSPSSKASSVSSRSSGSRNSRRNRKYLYDRPDSSRASTTSGFNGTEFSLGEPVRAGHESMSIRSGTSFASRSQRRTSNLRKEIMRSPNEANQLATMDLFPFTKARLREVAFRTPHYGNGARTADLLQREMLSTVFGWNEDADTLIREELSRHPPGSASAVLLAKWLGEAGADSMASMVGSESMTSSDWMLLALSSIGKDSQKKVGEAFVQRLLEKGDIHPAVAILLGLEEYDDAIEVYVSQDYWMEALLLACLTCPSDWGRQAFLLRKWGEVAVQQGQAELAVRCFSCAAAETSQTWFSPRAQQEAGYAAQQRLAADSLSAGSMTSPPLSPPSRSGSGRLTAKNASLKLITSFGQRNAQASAAAQMGTTPIAESAVTPGGNWRQQKSTLRDPSSARTATPGGVARRKRLPSKDQIERAKQETAELLTPQTTLASAVTPQTVLSVATRDFAPERNASRQGSRASNASSIPEPATALRPAAFDAEMLNPSVRDDNHLPSPAQGVFTRLRQQSRPREDSRDRKPDGLAVDIIETRYADNLSPAPSTGNDGSVYSSRHAPSRAGTLSPPLTGGSAKARAIDDYISSVEEARTVARQERTRSRPRGESRKRDESRARKGAGRARDLSSTRGKDDIRYIKPAKRSPSSPVPMSPEEIAQASQPKEPEPATTDDESFYRVTSPTVSHKSLKSPMSIRSNRSGPQAAQSAPRESSPDRLPLPSDDDRGRTFEKSSGSAARSPSMPLPVSPAKHMNGETDDTESDGQRFRIRARSASRGAASDLQSRRAASRNRRAEPSLRGPEPPGEQIGMFLTDLSKDSLAEETGSISSRSNASGTRGRKPSALTKMLAAKELEERRLSLARRPSAPSIPLPGELQPAGNRPALAPRSYTELGDSPKSTMPPISRSQTVDPDAMSRYNDRTNPKPGVMLPPMGLPATPRAMRNPRQIGADANPPVPEIPGNFSELSSVGAPSSMSGSSLSQMTTSYLSQDSASVLPNSQVSSNVPFYGQSQVSSSLQSAGGLPREQADDVAPLLPSTFFGQKFAQDPARSASAPPEKMMNPGGVHPAYKANLPPTRRLSIGRGGQIRKISPPEAANSAAAPSTINSIDEALNSDQQVVFIPESSEVGEIILPELQHLAGPPPPPPPPTMFQHGNEGSSDVINITIASDSIVDIPPAPATLPSTTFSTLPSTTFSMANQQSPPTSYPAPMERSATASPSMHRRGRGSVSDSFGSRGFIKGVTDRMRSQSRGANRAKSPPMPTGAQFNPSPYETILPPVPTASPQSHRRRESISRAKSPYEQAMAEQQIQLPPPPPPAPAMRDYETKIMETAIPPTTLPQSRAGSTTGYRNPKEIRANMPPETLQQGVYHAGGFL